MAIEPVTREERFLAAAGGQSVTPPTPITRKEQLLQGIIDAVKYGGATPDVIEGAVNDYLNANPVQPGATTEQAAQIEQNKTDIADLQTEVDELKESGGNGSGQNLTLDTTLSQSGKAADAKATGDEIKRVEGLIPNIEGLAKTEEIPTKPEDIGAQPKGNYALASTVPTKVSQLANDKGYLTEHQDISGKVDKDKLTLSRDANGLLYLYIDGVPAGAGIELPTGGIDGYITEDKQIIFNNLPDGEYTLAYIAEDGRIVPIGAMEKDTNVYYTVKNTLTNCTSNNSATQAVQGGSYSATITAKSGYEMSSIKVTMGGTDISSTAVSGGKIIISNVTGNIVITAVAEVVASEPINQIPLSTDASGNLYNGGQGWKTGYRLSSSSGSESSQSGVEVTGFIPCKYTDTIYFKNITITTSGTETYCFYDSSRTRIAGGTTGGTFGTTSGGVISKAISSINNTQLQDAKDKVAFIRISANSITTDSIITVNEPIS